MDLIEREARDAAAVHAARQRVRVAVELLVNRPFDDVAVGYMRATLNENDTPAVRAAVARFLSARGGERSRAHAARTRSWAPVIVGGRRG
ncbi:hypothetical protein [Xylanimonas sp. McL0601]|uniref:hypothetical protein n=1 Tax=Xylanimonas sp. McL0601 TaxID=3414739 RepID=UPI003CFA8034